MGASVVKIALSGYYGFDNSGDEAVLQSILFALQEQGREQGVKIEPIVLSANPEKTSAMYGVKAYHRMKPGSLIRALREADGLISGGGSLLQDATSSKTIPYYLAVLKIAQWLGKPTFIYSQGIGPVSRPMFYGWIRSIFQRCSYVSVRDTESAELLGKMRLPRERITVVPDPVMGLPLARRCWWRRGGPRAGWFSADGRRVRPLLGMRTARSWRLSRGPCKCCSQPTRMCGCVCPSTSPRTRWRRSS